MARPYVCDRRKRLWVVEAAGGDVDIRAVVRPPVRQRSAAAPAECPCHRRRGVELHGLAADERQALRVEVNPRNDCGGRGLSAGAALARSAGQWLSGDPVTNCAAQASALQMNACHAHTVVPTIGCRSSYPHRETPTDVTYAIDPPRHPPAAYVTPDLITMRSQSSRRRSHRILILLVLALGLWALAWSLTSVLAPRLAREALPTLQARLEPMGIGLGDVTFSRIRIRPG